MPSDAKSSHGIWSGDLKMCTIHKKDIYKQLGV
jgi:hypothetical protein